MAASVNLSFVGYGSPPWQEARALRYALFFQPHRLPPSVMDDAHEAHATHLVAQEGGRVVGYGRLFYLEDGVAQISQMVVSPAHQGRGIGMRLLHGLLDCAAADEARSFELSARLPAIRFYTRAGFQPCGEVYASDKTGVLHVKMTLTPCRSADGMKPTR
jgi:predicted GNAT family N-acyltransferase